MYELSIAVFCLVCALLAWRFVFRIDVPADHFAILSKRFDMWTSGSKGTGFEAISIDGRAGRQALTLGPGRHFGFPRFQYSVELRQFIEIDSNEIGLVSAKEGSASEHFRMLGRYVECHDFQDGVAFLVNGGRKGRQSHILRPGKYKINPYLFDVFTSKDPSSDLLPHDFTLVSIHSDEIGLITATDGAPLEPGEIAGPPVPNHKSFQDVDEFIDQGGRKGLQEEFISSGEYYINPWFAKVEKVPLIKIPAGIVGVLISNVGSNDPSTKSGTRHRGIQEMPLKEGVYPINVRTNYVQPVPIYDITLEWSDAQKDANNYDASLAPLKLRSKDGFEFEIHITQVIKIDADLAPNLISEIGVAERWSGDKEFSITTDQKFSAVRNLITRQLKPTVAAHFANVAQNYEVLEFHSKREQLQEEASEAISVALEAIGVIGRRTDITDIELPPSIQEIAQKTVIEGHNIELIKKKQLAQRELTELAKRESETEAIRELERLKIEIEGAEYKDEIRRINIKTDLEELEGKIKARGGPEADLMRHIAEELAKLKLPTTMLGGDAQGLVHFKVLSDLVGKIDQTDWLKDEKKMLE